MNDLHDEVNSFEFSLTEEMIDQIIFYMEDQSGEYLINIKTGVIVPADSGENEDMAPLPQWRSSDGYLMMEKFVSSLHNPVYKEELRDVLSMGKGVFRNFKKIVKSYEPLKRRWYNFKDRYLKDLVVGWYNANNEASYFVRMGTDSLETDDIVMSDFSFSSDCVIGKEITFGIEERLFAEIFPDDPVMGRYYYAGIKEILSDPSKEILSVCAGAGDDGFAGIIWGVVWSCEEGSLLAIKEFYVKPEFRGLGLGKVMLEMLSDRASEAGLSRIHFEVPGSFPYIESMLEKQDYQPVSRSFGKKLPLSD